jgi:signal transduction histidine kinase
MMTSELARRRLRVLIVEDSDAGAAPLVRALRRERYDVSFRRVDTADAMRAALDAAEWDLVVSDHDMPMFSGPEALALLHETELDLPFIFVSGSVGEELAVAAMKAGAHDFFLKDRLAGLGAAVARELREAEIRRERRLAEERLRNSERELRSAVQSRDEFLSIASHELRTPLTPLTLQLQSALRLLRRQTANGDGQEELGAKIDSCLRHVERMRMLIGNLLDVTRITSGRMMLARTEQDLRVVVKSVVRRVVEAMRSAEVRIHAPEPVIGFWDEGGLESVVVNLISNAIKYGEGKPIDITVERVGARARLSVVDRGMGIAEEAQSRIFDRFERAVPAEHYGGFGIGLWVVRQVVEAHGGTIRVASRPGKGSTFVVELDLSGPDHVGAQG